MVTICTGETDIYNYWEEMYSLSDIAVMYIKSIHDEDEIEPFANKLYYSKM